MFKFKIRSHHIPWVLIAVLPMMAYAEPFQVREVMTTGSESTESFDFERGDHRETLFLSPNALITNADVKEAKLKESDGGSYQLHVQLTVDGARSLAKATAIEGKGPRRLALLVHGKVFSAPMVTQQIISGKLEILGGEDLEEAQRILASVTTSSSTKTSNDRNKEAGARDNQ